ncbi:MAG: hypothetical protein KF841_16765 [Phycisphaerae bacterium]|nr:hypothetical protein [Phycisphaerae bacterium]
MRKKLKRTALSTIVLASVALFAPACDTLDPALVDAIIRFLDSFGNSNGNHNSNNNNNDNNAGIAGVVFTVHGRPIDGYREINLTVNSVELIGDGEHGEIELMPPVRINLINPDFSEFLACISDAPVGSFNKLRLRVSEPEFVKSDDTVIGTEMIQLNANGKIDLNTQGDHFEILDDENQLIEFKLGPADNALKVTQTGNDKFILRTEVFVRASATISKPFISEPGEIIEIRDDSISNNNNNNDDSDNNNEDNDNQSDGPADRRLIIHASNCELEVVILDDTEIVDSGDQPLTFEDLLEGDIVVIVGAYDVDGVIIATKVVLQLD